MRDKIFCNIIELRKYMTTILEYNILSGISFILYYQIRFFIRKI